VDNLLKIAIEAHGGLNAWNQFESLRASISIGGALWDQKELFPTLVNGSYLHRIKSPWNQTLGRVSMRASIRGHPSQASPLIPNGTNCMPAISAVTRYGDTSPRRFSTHTRGSRREKLSPGKRTETRDVAIAFAAAIRHEL
jgi:hypothetical protein